MPASSPDLINAYRHMRRQSSTRNASTALRDARIAMGAGKTFSAPWRPAPRAPQPALFFDSEENARANGFRFVGFADDIARLRGCWRSIDHTGWYADAFQDETFRGAVFQITGKARGARFVAGYRESCSEGFVVDLGEVYSATPDDQCGCDPRDNDAALDAARAADRFAEREAEKAREYSEAWSAGSQWADLKQGEADERREALAIAAEAKAVRAKVSPADAPTVCAILRGRIEAARDSILASRAKREELRDSVWRDYFAAFNDGAGSAVFA
jgi:hypothetical protein